MAIVWNGQVTSTTGSQLTGGSGNAMRKILEDNHKHLAEENGRLRKEIARLRKERDEAISALKAYDEYTATPPIAVGRQDRRGRLSRDLSN